MLNATTEALLHDVNAYLTGQGDATAMALAARLADTLRTSAQQRAAMAERAKAQRGRARGGRPALRYAIELEPGWVAHAIGSKAARAKAAEACEQHGQRRRAPSLAAVQMAISRNGAWTTLLETDNGTATLTVRPLREDGTDLAPSKERANSQTK